MNNHKGTAFTDNVSIGNTDCGISPDMAQKVANSGMVKYGKEAVKLESFAVKELMRLRKEGIDPSKR